MGNSFSLTPASGADTPVLSASGMYLTSREEIERLYSQTGVNLREDDQSNDDIINEIVAWASETVESYTLSHYNTTDLVSSPYTRRRATILGAYYLSMRRANAPQFVAEAKRVLEDLEAIQKNQLLIPDAVVRAADVPCISSYRIDDRYIINKQRVVGSQSTNPYEGQQKYDLPFLGGDFI